MAIPMIISMLFQSFYNIIDSVFVSRISENALTAVSLVFPLQNLCIAIGSGTGVGMNALLSRSLGEKKQDMVDRTANTGIFCMSAVMRLLYYWVYLPCSLFYASDQCGRDNRLWTRIWLHLSLPFYRYALSVLF